MPPDVWKKGSPMTAYTWNASAGGTWTGTKGLWNPTTGFPGTSDSADLSSLSTNYTVTISSGYTPDVLSLTLENPTGTGAATLAIATGGSLDVLGLLNQTAGTVTENGGTSDALVAGTLTVSGGTFSVGNAGTGVAQIQSGGIAISGSGTVSVGGSSTNRGTITDFGSLSIGGSGALTITGGAHPSTVSAASIAQSGGAITLSGTSTLSTTGTMSQSAGMISAAAGLLATSSLTESGGVIALTGGSLDVTGALNQTAGTISNNSGTAATVGTLTVSGGTFNAGNAGTGIVTVGGGGTTINGSGTVSVGGMGANSGTLATGALTVGGGAALTIIGGTAATTVSAASITQSGGTITLTGGNTGTLSTTGPLSQSGGTINVNAGILSSSGTLTQNGATAAINVTGGTLSTGSGALKQTLGAITVTGGSLLVGGALTQSSGGTITIGAGTLNTGSYTQGGGTLNFVGNGTLELNAGAVGATKFDFGTSDGTLFWNTTTAPTTSVTIDDFFGGGSASNSDVLDVKYSTGGALTETFSNETLTIKNGSTTVFSVLLAHDRNPSARDYTASDFTVTNDGTSGGYIQLTSSYPCFLRGTRIATLRGDVAVEDLRIGDLLITDTGGAQPVKWIGTRAYITRMVHEHHRAALMPVRIAAGALAEGSPARDLFVSAEHMMCLNDVLVPAEKLLNGTTITRCQDFDVVQYFHVELPRHSVIYADGAPAESFLDTGNRNMFSNVLDYLGVSNGLDSPAQTPCRPVITEGEMLVAVRARVAERAAREASLPPGKPTCTCWSTRSLFAPRRRTATSCASWCPPAPGRSASPHAAWCRPTSTRPAPTSVASGCACAACRYVTRASRSMYAPPMPVCRRAFTAARTVVAGPAAMPCCRRSCSPPCRTDSRWS